MNNLQFRVRDLFAKTIGTLVLPVPATRILPAFLQRARQRALTIPAPERQRLEPPFYSQYGQDQYVWSRLLKGSKEKGVFCEIGAADGITNSNTYFFEKELGWEGYCIDPNPLLFDKLRSHRSAKCFNCGIAAKSGRLEFLRVDGNGEQLSCFRDFASLDHLGVIEAQKRSNHSAVQSISVEVLPFNQFASENQILHIDFLSIDAEGMEKQILSTIDFRTVNVRFIAVEANCDPVELELFMNTFSYRLCALVGTDHIYSKI